MIHSRDTHGWPSLVIEAQGVAVAVPKMIGPRLIHFGPDIETNLFYIKEDEKGGANEPEWKLRGGHRLWAAPEDPERTAQPDNSPVDLSADDDGLGIEAIGPLEAATGLVKRIHARVVAERVVAITHSIDNHNLWPIDLAPWSLSVFPRGGRALLPLPKPDFNSPQMTCSHTINGWPYTRWHEPCWQWHEQGLMLDTVTVEQKQKVGFGGDGCWLAMVRNGWLVVKLGMLPSDGTFTDRGAQLHVYADEAILELETLGEYATLPPAASAVHRDYLTFKAVDANASHDDLWHAAASLAAEIEDFADQMEGE